MQFLKQFWRRGLMRLLLLHLGRKQKSLCDLSDLNPPRLSLPFLTGYHEARFRDFLSIFAVCLRCQGPQACFCALAGALWPVANTTAFLPRSSCAERLSVSAGQLLMLKENLINACKTHEYPLWEETAFLYPSINDMTVKVIFLVCAEHMLSKVCLNCHHLFYFHPVKYTYFSIFQRKNKQQNTEPISTTWICSPSLCTFPQNALICELINMIYTFTKKKKILYLRLIM